jgi:hypothetical protein
MKRLALAGMLSIITGLLTCGCLAGVVTDAVSGNPIGDAQVRWVDSNGNSGQTTTNPLGIYVFDAGKGDAVPVSGPVFFSVSWLSDEEVCANPFMGRLVEYDDRPASISPGEPWEIQNFAVQRPDFCRPNLSPEPTSTPTRTPVPTSTPVPLMATPKVPHVPTPTPTHKPGFIP